MDFYLLKLMHILDYDGDRLPSGPSLEHIVLSAPSLSTVASELWWPAHPNLEPSSTFMLVGLFEHVCVQPKCKTQKSVSWIVYTGLL